MSACPTWFPFTVQIYVNGHSWLEKQMLKRRIGFNLRDNAFTALDDPQAAQKLARFVRPSELIAKILDRLWLAKVAQPFDERAMVSRLPQLLLGRRPS